MEKIIAKMEKVRMEKILTKMEKIIVSIRSQTAQDKYYVRFNPTATL